MDNGLSATLKTMRKAQGLTLVELAQRAGVTHPTLSRWERGVCLPRLPELEAVLKALKVSPAQRRQALKQMETPRAALRLDTERRQNAPEFLAQAGTLPHGGDLLRAMRHRRGWKLEDLANALSLSASTLSRWEQGDTWPSPERLHRLCSALSASQAEIEALTCGRFSLADFGLGGRSLEALEHDFRAHLEPLMMVSELNPGLELRFLRLEAALWPHALRRDSVRPLLADVYAHHANYLRNFRCSGVQYAPRAGLDAGCAFRFP
jgi:transcriptional regulator with XRE-family HTH domain